MTIDRDFFSIAFDYACEHNLVGFNIACIMSEGKFYGK